MAKNKYDIVIFYKHGQIHVDLLCKNIKTRPEKKNQKEATKSFSQKKWSGSYPANCNFNFNAIVTRVDFFITNVIDLLDFGICRYVITRGRRQIWNRSLIWNRPK